MSASHPVRLDCLAVLLLVAYTTPRSIPIHASHQDCVVAVHGEFKSLGGSSAGAYLAIPLTLALRTSYAEFK